METMDNDEECENQTEHPIEEETALKGEAVPPASFVTSSIASSPEEEVQLAVEFRKIFVELFDELDGREGFATYALLEGLDFTNDAVGNGKALADWEMTAKVCNSWTEPADRYITKILRNITSCFSSRKKHRQVFHDAKQINPEHERAIRVVRMS